MVLEERSDVLSYGDRASSDRFPYLRRLRQANLKSGCWCLLLMMPAVLHLALHKPGTKSKRTVRCGSIPPAESVTHHPL